MISLEDDNIFLAAIRIGCFAGYGIPLTLLLGWHLHDTLLWVVVVLAFIEFGIYGAATFFSDMLYKYNSKISFATTMFVRAAEATSAVILGSLISNHKDGNYEGILLMLAAVVRVLTSTLDVVRDATDSPAEKEEQKESPLPQKKVLVQRPKLSGLF